MIKAFQAIVKGRVQMVMYRDFAARFARAEGIVGSARNLSDGTVEVVAEGTEKALTNYLERLKKGSLLARVDEVEVSWTTPSNAYADFSILL